MEEEDGCVSNETRSLSVSIGINGDFFSENDWLNVCDAAFGTIALVFLLACATSVDLLKTQRNSGQDWTKPLD